LSSVALSAITVIFGAAPLKAVRHILGAGPFWLLGLGLSVIFLGLKLPALAVVLLLFTVAVGAWTHLEESGYNLAQSALGGLLSAAAVAVSLFYLAIQKDPTGWHQKLVSSTEKALSEFSAVQMVKSMNVEDLVGQLPAMLTIGLLISLALAAVLERPIANWAGVPVGRKEKLTDFRLPDFMIWAVIFSLFGAFWQGSPKPVETLCLNILNVSLVLYFFQGMAVLCKYCVVFRVGAFWRTILVLVFTLQLFFILSLVGVVDFWADFRKQFAKRSADLKKRRTL
jgi:hypothetical protein